MDTQRKDVIALKEDVNRLRNKYEDARNQRQYNDDALEEKESAILDFLNGELLEAETSTATANDEAEFQWQELSRHCNATVTRSGQC